MSTLRFVAAFCVLLPSLAFAVDPATQESRVAKHITLLNSEGIHTVVPATTAIEARAADVAPTFNLAPDQLKSWLNCTYVGVGSRRLTCWVSVIVPGSSGVNSTQLLDAILDGIGPAIETEYQSVFDRQSREFEESRAAAKAKQTAATERAEKLGQEIAGLTGVPQNDIDSIQATSLATADKLQAMELEFLGKTQRKKAVVEQISERSAVIEQEAEKDLIVAELRKVVEAREASLEIVKQQKDAGVSPAKDVTDAIAALADARARLLERRRQASIDAGAAALQELNRELITLSIDLREIDARQAFLDSRLRRLRHASALIDEQRRCWTEMSNAALVLSRQPPANAGRVSVVVNDE